MYTELGLLQMLDQIYSGQSFYKLVFHICIYFPVFTSLLRPAVISETQRLRLDAVQTLCNWCSYCREGSSSQLKSEVDVKYIRSKLINLLTENSFDVGRPVDIQIVGTILALQVSKKMLRYCFPGVVSL